MACSRTGILATYLRCEPRKTGGKKRENRLLVFDTRGFFPSSPPPPFWVVAYGMGGKLHRVCIGIPACQAGEFAHEKVVFFFLSKREITSWPTPKS